MSIELREIQLVCFRVGDTLFGVDIMRIKEIIPPQLLSSLPTPSRFLEGVVNLRGTVIPVMNMRKRFGMPAAVGEEPGAIIIVKLARQLLALNVDEVLEVISVMAEDIKLPLEIEAGVGVECIIGVCLSQNRVYMLLGIDSLIVTADGPGAVPNTEL